MSSSTLGVAEARLRGWCQRPGVPAAASQCQTAQDLLGFGCVRWCQHRVDTSSPEGKRCCFCTKNSQKLPKGSLESYDDSPAGGRTLAAQEQVELRAVCRRNQKINTELIFSLRQERTI